MLQVLNNRMSTSEWYKTKAAYSNAWLQLLCCGLSFCIQCFLLKKKEKKKKKKFVCQEAEK